MATLARPLEGKRVLVTRARDQAGGTAALLREVGAEPVLVPTIEIGPPDDPAALAAAVADLRAGAYGWVAFTSENGVERTWEAVVAAGGDGRAFDGARLAVVGPGTAAALERHGLKADVQAKEYKGEGLAAAMLASMETSAGAAGISIGARPGAGRGGAGRADARPGRRVLLARAAKGRDALPDALRAAGWTVDVVAAYQTRPPARQELQALAQDLEAGRIDIVTFTSGSTVDHLCDALDGLNALGTLGADSVRLLARPLIASIGPITTEAARTRGLRVDVTADKHTLPGLVEALIGAMSGRAF